jgi:hypothetical protein
MEAIFWQNLQKCTQDIFNGLVIVLEHKCAIVCGKSWIISITAVPYTQFACERGFAEIWFKQKFRAVCCQFQPRYMHGNFLLNQNSINPLSRTAVDSIFLHYLTFLYKNLSVHKNEPTGKLLNQIYWSNMTRIYFCHLLNQCDFVHGDLTYILNSLEDCTKMHFD